MKMEILKINLFENISQCQIENRFIDLHNNYQCTKINYIDKDKTLVLLFVTDDLKEEVKLMFYEVDILEFDLNFDNIGEILVVDNIYRGRYELRENLYDSADNKGFIYIEFCDEKKIVLIGD